jgi:hypothetical protein
MILRLHIYAFVFMNPQSYVVISVLYFSDEEWIFLSHSFLWSHFLNVTGEPLYGTSSVRPTC